MLPRH